MGSLCTVSALSVRIPRCIPWQKLVGKTVTGEYRRVVFRKKAPSHHSFLTRPAFILGEPFLEKLAERVKEVITKWRSLTITQ